MFMVAAEAGAGGVPLWVYFLSTLGGLALSTMMVGLATYPLWKDRRATESAAEKREERLDATADAVLGREADVERGRPKLEGLLTVMTKQAYQVDEMRGLMDHMINAQRESTDKAESARAEIIRTFEVHEISDNERFAKLEKSLAAIRRSVSRKPRGNG